MDLGLKGKKALVMGASQGLGKAVAESLIQEGCEVAICARHLPRLERTAHEIGASRFFACDLSQPGEAQRVTREALASLGRIDILVTNTGGPAKGRFLEITENQWGQDFQCLWMSVVESLHVILPEMKRTGFGRVLMITSLAAREPLAGLTTSNGLRAGLAGLGKSIASEVAPFGITVNMLLPGYTNTDRIRELHLSEEKIKEMIPAGRLGDPRELADVATFLASPRAGYITGQSLAVDGGVLRSH
jgi:3-oxoacyl-[acyl-carrier protein] reductase